ncbi:MAG: CPBP family intramembrane glutamic endopeptidase [Haloarculaceae archaeon]
MEEVLAGVKRVFWNGDEKRLRAPFRIPAAVGLALLALQIVVGMVRFLSSALALPSTITTTVIIATLTVAGVAVAWFVDRRYRRDMGLELDQRWWLDAAAGLVVGLGMVAAVVVTLRLAGMASVGGPYRPSGTTVAVGDDSAALGLLYGFAFFVAVAVLEEFAVRGYLLTNVAEGLRGYVSTDRTAVWVAILGTAGLFGVLHAANPGGNWLSFLNITLAGVLLGIAYAATGRLAFPIGLHTTWNFGLGPLFGLPVSGLRADTALVPVRVDGPRLVTGGSFGPEGGLVMLVALAAGAGMLAWWVDRRDESLAPDERIAIPDLWTGESEDS